MKLSRPVINTIRFDTELEIVENRFGSHTRLECDAYTFDGVDENNQKLFGVGIRIRLNFYIDKLENEAAGYLSETESTVLTFLNSIDDKKMLNTFSKDVFRNIKHNLQRALPAFDLKAVDFPDPLDMANAHLEGLIKMGLYK